MSSLGITLLILVFVCIGGVIAYNIWISRRDDKAHGSLLDPTSPVADVSRAEPSLDEPSGESGLPTAEAAPYFGGAAVATGIGAAGASVASTKQTDIPEAANTDEAVPLGFGTSMGAEQTDEPILGEAVRDAESGEVLPAMPETDLTSERPPTDNLTDGVAHELIPEVSSDPDADADRVDTNQTNTTSDDAQAGAADIASEPVAEVSTNPADISPASAPPGVNTIDGSDSSERVSEPVPAASEMSAAADRGGRRFQADDFSSSSGLDRFDCIVNLGPLDKVAGARLLTLVNDFTRVGGKPVIVGAVPTGASSATAEPQPIEANQSYVSVVIALLLVNRHGPLNAMEYSEFVNRVQAIAEELDALADVPDMKSVLEHSAALETEIGSLDAQVAVNVVTENALTTGDLQSIAHRLNLTEQGNNRYVRRGPDRQPQFSVSLGDKPNYLVLLLDVPRVARDDQPLREMVECSWKCAQTFEGRMVDDAGQAIDNALFERIERQLDTHYQALQAAGVAAGSVQARRIFN